MSKLKDLQTTERDTTLNPRQLRSAGFIPATLYGKEKEPKSIQVRHHDFALEYGNGSREFNLTGLKADQIARVQQLQVDPVSQKVLSIQFIALDKASPPKPKKAKVEVQSEKPAKAEKMEEKPAVEPKAEEPKSEKPESEDKVLTNA